MNLYQLMRLLHLLDVQRSLCVAGILSPNLLVYYGYYRWHLCHVHTFWIDAILTVNCGKTTWYKAKSCMQTEVFSAEDLAQIVERLLRIIRLMK